MQQGTAQARVCVRDGGCEMVCAIQILRTESEGFTHVQHTALYCSLYRAPTHDQASPFEPSW
jgi:hypothetical protein